MDADALMIGARVDVPFGKQDTVGVLVGKTSQPIVALTKIKAANKLIDNAPLFTERLMQFTKF